MGNLKVWHGSQRWSGTPEIRPSRKGSYECGPGIYCTTSLGTAAKYARGGGRVVRFHIDPGIAWLEDAKMPFDEVMRFVESSTRLRKKRVLARDLESCYDRRDHLHFEGLVPVSFLVNLAVNNDCLSGQGSRELANWLADNGIQASLVKNSGEDWVVVIDPRIIVGHDVLSAKDIDWTADQLPRIDDQLETLRAPRPLAAPR